MSRRIAQTLVPLDLLGPLLAVLTLLCAAGLCGLPTWLPALATVCHVPWQIQRGGRVMPGAAACAGVVMALLWAYGVLAFLLILLAVVAVASLLRLEAGPPV